MKLVQCQRQIEAGLGKVSISFTSSGGGIQSPHEILGLIGPEGLRIVSRSQVVQQACIARRTLRGLLKFSYRRGSLVGVLACDQLENASVMERDPARLFLHFKDAEKVFIGVFSPRR